VWFLQLSPFQPTIAPHWHYIHQDSDFCPSLVLFWKAGAPVIEIVPISTQQQAVTALFRQLWGSTEMVVSSGVFDIQDLDGLVARQADRIVGIISYTWTTKWLEIVSLDSLVENQGIGSQLLQAAEKIAQENDRHQTSLITTNDNLRALGFYQKRGYHLTELYPNAVAKARQIKPEIPLQADNGIPIRDELRLAKVLH
jgi:GNAT superfamily N-acetyltransferase